ncbi:MAG: Sua5/YciO/YrdC/YwlC family protein [Nitrospirae bacterium]|nr:Sua5/YciO/YrdC/YwlC family protein [Nitrospirota bacterium]
MARIIKVDPKKSDVKRIKDAAEALKKGGIVAFPTDTFYGLGADAANDEAVKRIYAIKERDYDNYLSCIISSFSISSWKRQ